MLKGTPCAASDESSTIGRIQWMTCEVLGFIAGSLSLTNDVPGLTGEGLSFMNDFLRPVADPWRVAADW